MKIVYEDLQRKLYEVPLPQYYVGLAVILDCGDRIVLHDEGYGLSVRNPEGSSILIYPRANNDVVIFCGKAADVAGENSPCTH